MTITDAHAEATEAAALVEALEARILSGDDSVSADELDSARKLAEFAQMRIAGAERRAYEAERDQAEAALADAATHVRAVVTGPHKDIDALQSKATKAVDAYLNALEQQYVEARRAARGLRLANEHAAQFGLPDSQNAHGVEYGIDGLKIINDRGSLERYHWESFVDPAIAVANVVEPAGLHVEHGATIRSMRKIEGL